MYYIDGKFVTETDLRIYRFKEREKSIKDSEEVVYDNPLEDITDPGD